MKWWNVPVLIAGLGLAWGCSTKPAKEGEPCDQKKICEQPLRCFETKCCKPDCQGKVCGDDGCGVSCGACEAGTSCEQGQCKCTPKCEGKTCGEDGCGGSCGTCAQGTKCEGSACAPIPQEPKKVTKPGKAPAKHAASPKKSRKKKK